MQEGKSPKDACEATLREIRDRLAKHGEEMFEVQCHGRVYNGMGQAKRATTMAGVQAKGAMQDQWVCAHVGGVIVWNLRLSLLIAVHLQSRQPICNHVHDSYSSPPTS